MRRSFVALVFCFCSLVMYGQKERFGQALPHAKPGVDYPIKAHISGIHYRTEDIGSGQNENVIYADAVMDGEKLELRGDLGVPFQHDTFKLPLGDQRARLLKDAHKIGETHLFQVYEIVLPDKTVWRCKVTGVLE